MSIQLLFSKHCKDYELCNRQHAETDELVKQIYDRAVEDDGIFYHKLRFNLHSC